MCLVAFPAGVVGFAGRLKGKARLGHAEASFDDGGRDRVERTKALVPLVGCHADGHEVPGVRALELDVFRQEA